MLSKLPTKVTVIVVLAIIAIIVMAGCGSNSSQSTPSSSEQSVQQSTQQTTQQSTQQSTQQTTQQTTQQSTQQSGTQSGQQQPPSGQTPDNSKMDAVITRAAAILGVSADSFKKAFQNAMPQGRGSGSGQQGQPPSGQQPPSAPSGSSAQGPDMTAIYTKMAAELNVTADAIAKAMAQAQQELQK